MGRRWLSSHHFLEGGARLLQRRNAAAHFDEHLPKRENFPAATGGSVATDYDGGWTSERQAFTAGRDHAVNASAAAVVDKRVEAVEEGVTGMQHIGIGEKTDMSVSVCAGV